jgi:hypothetical protein
MEILKDDVEVSKCMAEIIFKDAGQTDILRNWKEASYIS